jgi:hypothetical protein
MQTSTIPIWEEKGIVIGVFAHIIKHHTYLMDKTIIINNDIYGSITKLFFDELTFKKYKKPHHKDPYYINIKDVTKTDNHHINNLNNFQIIHNKKITLLPWYDRDNPIIMFTYDKDQTANIAKLIDDLTYFEKHIRFTKFNSPGKTKTNCIIDCWDTYYERKILKKFVRLYPQYSVGQVNDQINELLLYPNCCNKSAVTNPLGSYVQNMPIQQQIKYVQVPGECKPEIKYIKSDPEIKEVIKYVKSEPEIKEVIKYLPAPIPLPIPIPKTKLLLPKPINPLDPEGLQPIIPQPQKQCTVNEELIKLITQKTKIVNDMLNQNTQELDEVM